MKSPTVAIVGSGPSGCYLAQALRKEWPHAEITLFDRMPVPYGLVRYGVAPDHPGTKNVVRQFERLFERDNIGFAGNVEIGRDIPLDVLREAYDIVVLATGLHGDRPLDIPGADQARVYGAGRLTRLLNDHPDEQGFRPRLGETTVIVGNGNVAIDVLRLLAKSVEEFDNSEITDEVLGRLLATPLRHIHIVGRSPARQAKFDTLMLRELAGLRRARFDIRDLPEPGGEEDKAVAAKLEALRALKRVGQGELDISFHFGWQPESLNTEEDGYRFRFKATDGSKTSLRLTADSVITAIGFTQQPDSHFCKHGLSRTGADPDASQLAPGLYCTGWFKRGPTGTIPENRADAKAVAALILAQAAAMGLGKPGFAALPAAITGKLVDYAGWKRIDAAEVAAAPAGRIRQKIRDTAEMLRIVNDIHQGEPQS
ncbi:FAD-dependent oxidoreductase [Zobellella aerophila]|uniref:FAD-dependent oxidoreductase n=1 Tax=Zobellella aerophila TaxID=870480 RepID=A0ABP6VYS9_9GAMM